MTAAGGSAQVCYVDRVGAAHAVALDAAPMIDFEDAAPVRSFPTWPHKRSYDGWWWSATTNRHIGFESWLERDHLMLFDHDPTVVGIASQPCWIVVNDDTQHGEPQLRHAPDYFLRLRDGTGVLVDVRPRDRIDQDSERVFDHTREVCQRVGWQYRVCIEIDPTHARNVRWLSGYRHPRFGADRQWVDRLLSAFAEPLPLTEGLAKCGDGLHWQAVLYHLLWHQMLRYEQALPLDGETLIQPSPGGSSLRSLITPTA